MGPEITTQKPKSSEASPLSRAHSEASSHLKSPQWSFIAFKSPQWRFFAAEVSLLPILRSERYSCLPSKIEIRKDVSILVRVCQSPSCFPPKIRRWYCWYLFCVVMSFRFSWLCWRHREEIFWFSFPMEMKWRRRTKRRVDWIWSGGIYVKVD